MSSHGPHHSTHSLYLSHVWFYIKAWAMTKVELLIIQAKEFSSMQIDTKFKWVPKSFHEGVAFFKDKNFQLLEEN